MENKEKIIQTLEEFGRIPTGRLCAIIGMNYNTGLELLQEMWEAGEIVAEHETNATYWSIKHKESTGSETSATTSSSKTRGKEK